MSLTLLAWSTLLGALLILAFKRPAYGVSVYMLTFFAEPDLWWWGRPIAGYRWNLYGGIALLVSVIVSRLLQTGSEPASRSRLSRLVGWLAVAMLVNATAVHLFLAPITEISAGPYWLLAKFVLLFFLISASIRTRADLRIVLLSIVLGAGYIGYECTVNDRGRLRGNRLEGVGAPGATGANQLASLMVTVLPTTGAFFLAGKRWERLAMLPIAPFILNVIILCNSRGAFLSLIAAAGFLVLCAPPRARKRIITLLCLGGVATWLLLGDPRIVDRFMSTFVDAEHRDHSAQGRIAYWTAGLRMLSDHPFGTGGDGFKRVYGPQYITVVSGESYDARSVHNGYINEACNWGVQGLFFQLAFIAGGVVLMWRTARSPATADDRFARLIGVMLLAGLSGFLVECMFGSFLDAEWGFWCVATACGYARVYSVCEAAAMQLPGYLSTPIAPRWGTRMHPLPGNVGATDL